MNFSDIKENVLWNIYDKPKDIYRTIKHWFYCNWNIYHWRVVKAAFASHPWDYSFGFDLEEKMIDKQIHWFEHHQLMVDTQYEQIMRSLRWAKYCIHIMNNETDLFDYTGEIKWVDNDDGKTSTADTRELVYHYNGPRINWRNSSRFINEYQRKFFGRSPHELYLRKVKHLYYELRKNYTEYWWD